MVPGARRLWTAVGIAFVVETKVRGVRKGGLRKALVIIPRVIV